MNFLLRYVFHNIFLKLLSLAIALFLWWAVGHDPMAEIAVNVPIEFHHVPGNLEISTEAIPQAQIRLRGPARSIRELAQSQIHPIIDLDGAAPGERTFDLSSQHIRVPRNVEVVQVVPTQFRISFDKRTSREVEVQARVIGSFPTGYRLGKVVSDPAKIGIIGPEKRVNAIDSAITDPVDASGVVGHATFTTNVYVADPLVRVSNPEPVHVTVTTEKSNTR